MASERLYLGNASFSPENQERVSSALGQNKSLVWLEIPNSRWTDKTVPALCMVLQQNQTLTYLALVNADLSEKNLIRFCESFVRNKTLIGFDLSNCQWTQESIDVICDFIEHTRLQIIQLRAAQFTPAHITRLCEVLQENQTLQQLDLTNTSWSSASVEALCACIRANTTLVSLGLRYAAFSPDQTLQLLEALSTNHRLYALSLQYSTWGEESLDSLCACLTQNTILQSLSLTKSEFSNTALKKMFGDLSRNKVLQNVSFHSSVLTDAAADAISHFLQSNSQLQELWFGASQYTDQGLADLMSSLSHNDTLKDLTFSSSLLTDTVLPDIYGMVQDNDTINTISFDRSTFTDSGVSALMKTLAQNKTLQSLGRGVTNSILSWCLQELINLHQVEEVRLDGKSMEMKIMQAGIRKVIKPRSTLGASIPLQQGPHARSADSKMKKVKEPWYKAFTSRFRQRTDKPKKPSKEAGSTIGSIKAMQDKLEPTLEGTDGPLQNLDKDADLTKTFDTESLQKTFPTSGVPDELYLLDEEYIQAYQDACAGGTQTVCQCRVMLLGHEAAGKTSIKNSLLDQPFQHQHHITNAMEIEREKTRNWESITGIDEHAELIATYMVNAITLQEEDERPDTPTASPPILSSPAGHELLLSAHEAQEHSLPKPDHEDEALAAETVACPDVSATQCRPVVSTVQHDIHMKDDPTDSTLQDDAAQLHVIPPGIVEILKRRLRTKKTDTKDDVSVDLHFWDSGGQGIFYNTTKTFLTRRCVYLLAMDMLKRLHDAVPTWRKNCCGQNVVDTGCPQVVSEHLEYWLNCLHTFSSGNDQYHPSVIIIGTHKDGCTAAEVDAFNKDIWDCIKNKPYENDVRAVITLSNKSRDDRDLDHLKQLIIDLAQQQSYLLPLTWFVFRDELLKCCGTPVPRITLDQAIQLGRQHGMSGEKDVKAALSFFSEVGDILFFDEPTLHDFIIGQPQWLVDQFREVLTVPAFHEQQLFPNSRSHFRRLDEEGVLHEAVLHNVWPEEARQELIALMMKFALLLPMPAGYSLGATEDGATRYLVPCLLPLADPDVEQADTSTAIPPLTLLPPNGFIPVGLTSRLFTGLVNEEYWKVVDRIYGDRSTFLPNGNDSTIEVTIRQKKDIIDIHAKELMGTTSDGELHKYLSTILHRLEAITSSICPLKNFNIGMHCPHCREKGVKSVICLGYRAQQRRPFMYCTAHRDNCSTSEVSIWFNDIRVEYGSGAGSNTGEVLQRPRTYQKLTYDEVESLLRKHKGSFFKRFMLTENVMAELERADVISADTTDECKRDRLTPNEKIDVLLDWVRAAGVTAFINFCLVLCDKHIKQHELVTEVMGLSVADLQQQREEMLQDDK